MFEGIWYEACDAKMPMHHKREASNEFTEIEMSADQKTHACAFAGVD